MVLPQEREIGVVADKSISELLPGNHFVGPFLVKLQGRTEFLAEELANSEDGPCGIPKQEGTIVQTIVAFAGPFVVHGEYPGMIPMQGG